MITWRHQYDDAADAAAREAAMERPHGPSLTQQNHADDANINIIVRRFGITDGAIPPAVLDPSYYGDFSNVPDMRTALDQVRTAEQHFAELPADLRRRFGNSPAQLYEFVSNPDNTDEAVTLGLLARAVQPAPAKEPTTAPATETPQE